RFRPSNSVKCVGKLRAHVFSVPARLIPTGNARCIGKEPVMGNRPKKLLAALFGAALLIIVGSLQGTAHAAAKAPSWHMIWNDEFGGNQLDQHKWNAENIASPRNNELEYYIPRNVSVHNGHLSIISKHEAYQGQDYTSAAVDTYQKF